MERIILARLDSHLQSFPSLSPFQSAFRKLHSTETALLRITNDLLSACNSQKVSALVLLDLSAAFDTLDHHILLSRLSINFGITGSALSVLSSYLSNRTQSVVVGNSSSGPSLLTTGVPQGSVLGPLLFCLYTSPLSNLFEGSPISHHFDADDTQLYFSFSSSESVDSLSKLSSMLDDVYNWFSVNRLCLNPSKTEYLLIGTPQQRSKVVSPTLAFQHNSLTPNPHARNLGVILDPDFSFKNHISSLCSSSFYYIRLFRQLRSSLDHSSALLLANSLVSMKLDYCNSLLYGLPKTSLNRLQRVQNSLARVVDLSVKFSQHISPTLRKLHWLPIVQCITYKIASLTFKTLHHKQPSCLFDLIHPYTPSRTLRSSVQHLLTIPHTKTAIGRRAF